jgi:hypothetical protein
MKGYFCSNPGHPSKIQWLRSVSSSSAWSSRTECRETPWPVAWASSSSSYNARNLMRFDPTRSRRQGVIILPTYYSGNGPREASNREVAQAAFNNGGDDVHRHSNSKDFSGGGGVGRGSSSKRWIGTGGSCIAARWRRCGSAMAARVWVKFARDKALLIGGFASNHRQQKS